MPESLRRKTPAGGRPAWGQALAWVPGWGWARAPALAWVQAWVQAPASVRVLPSEAVPASASARRPRRGSAALQHHHPRNQRAARRPPGQQQTRATLWATGSWRQLSETGQVTATWERLRHRSRLCKPGGRGMKALSQKHRSRPGAWQCAGHYRFPSEAVRRRLSLRRSPTPAGPGTPSSPALGHRPAGTRFKALAPAYPGPPSVAARR